MKGSCATVWAGLVGSRRCGGSWGLISQTVFIKSFCKSQFPHKSVNLFFIITTIRSGQVGEGQGGGGELAAKARALNPQP